jgi:hypothetical protein
MSYTAAVKEFLQRNGSGDGLLIVQPDGSWVHLPSGYCFALSRYARSDNPAAALIEAATDLDRLNS